MVLVLSGLSIIGYNRWRHLNQTSNVTKSCKAAFFVAQILHVLVLRMRNTHHCCIVPLMKLIFKDQHNDKSPHTS